MGSVPITILLYNGLLLCGFTVPIKGLVLIDLISWKTYPKLHLTYVSNMTLNLSH